jgi:hypothetical protein
MKSERTFNTGSLTDGAILPADFAERVLLIARRKSQRRRMRNRIATNALILLVATIPLATLVRQRHSSLAVRDSAGFALAQSNQDALAYQLAQAMNPRSAGDCLLPDASALARFTFTYNDVVWQDDPRSNFYR